MLGKPSSMTEFLLGPEAGPRWQKSRGRIEISRWPNYSSRGGANPLIGFDSDQSAFEWAVRRMNPAMVELFLQTIVAQWYQSVRGVDPVRL